MAGYIIETKPQGSDTWCRFSQEPLPNEAEAELGLKAFLDHYNSLPIAKTVPAVVNENVRFRFYTDRDLLTAQFMALDEEQLKIAVRRLVEEVGLSTLEDILGAIVKKGP